MSTDLTIIAWLDAECQTFRTRDPRHYDKPLVLESDALSRIIGLRTKYEAMLRSRDLEKRWRKDSEDLATSLAERVKVLEAAINEHNEDCIKMCESSKGQKHCSSYLSRGRSACPDCPRDMMIDSASTADKEGTTE